MIKQVDDNGDEVLQCGRRINRNNWMNTFVYEVKAVLDNLVEPDQNLILDVSADILFEESIYSSNNIDNISVSCLCQQ